MKIVNILPVEHGLALISKHLPDSLYHYHESNKGISKGYWIRRKDVKDEAGIFAHVTPDLLTIRVFVSILPKWIYQLAAEIESKTGNEVTVVVGKYEQEI